MGSNPAPFGASSKMWDRFPSRRQSKSQIRKVGRADAASTNWSLPRARSLPRASLARSRSAHVVAFARFRALRFQSELLFHLHGGARRRLRVGGCHSQFFFRCEGAVLFLSL